MAWRKYSVEEVLDLVFADQENGHSSAPESCFTEDEEEFLQGLDPYQDSSRSDPQQPSTSQQSPQPPPRSETSSISRGDDDEEFFQPVRGRQRTCKRGSRSRGYRSRSHGCRSHGPNFAFAPSVQPKRWKTEEEADSLPQPLPRFLPRNNPGVQPPLSCEPCPSPMELFKLFFDKKTIGTLCNHTNKNAAKNITAGKKFAWNPVTPAEMSKYIGLVFYMGVLKLPNVKDFWRRQHFFHVPSPSRVLSRDRFLLISRNLHMSDPEEDAVNDSKKGTDDYDRLHRLRPLYDSLRTACKAVYHPQKNLSVDERMVATKARIGMKQYIKNKPKKWGIKLFVLADSSGYTVDFNIYTGKNKSASGRGLSFDAVVSLVEKEYLGTGYHIYVDNFYTSPALFRHLWDLGFGACGTYRQGRVGTPNTKENELTKSSQRGSIRWIRDGQLLFVKWMDTREVSVCSTVHTAYSGETVLRGRKTTEGYQKVAVARPTSVGEYNRFMGGVDLSDQLIGYYSTSRKSTKWYKTVFHHFLDIAATNSHILHKQLCASRDEQPLTHQAFQELLSAELCGVSLQHSQPSPEREQCHHTPVAIATGNDPSKKATVGRKKCKLCGKNTPFQCRVCRLPLCVIVDRNCHDDYHNDQL